MNLSLLRELLVRPDFSEFRQAFEHAAEVATAAEIDELRALGADAFSAFAEAQAGDPALRQLQWFADQYRAGKIGENEQLRGMLLKLEHAMRREHERRRYASYEPTGPIFRTKRVVQLSWFGFAGFQSSDAFEVRRSVFLSPQEREFFAAARLRFPGLVVLPNYPLRQVIDLDRLNDILPPGVIAYGRQCLLDFVLVTPREGDPVAAFELDSNMHDDIDRKTADGWKNALMTSAHLPLFRLRSDDPNSTTADEWYSVLTDEVADKIDCGQRIRSREMRTTVVPIVR